MIALIFVTQLNTRRRQNTTSRSHPVLV